MFHTLNPCNALRKEETPSYSHSVGTEAQSLHHVRPARNTTIHVDLKWPARFLFRVVRRGEPLWRVKQSLGDPGLSAIFGAEKVWRVFPDFQ